MWAMADRGPVLITLAIGGGFIALVVLALFRPPSRVGSRDRPDVDDPAEASQPAAPQPLRLPPAAVAEFGLLSERPVAELEAWLDRKHVSAVLGPRTCGDAEDCAMAANLVADEAKVHLEVVPGENWHLGRLDAERIATDLTAKERARLDAMVRASRPDAGGSAHVLV